MILIVVISSLLFEFWKVYYVKMERNPTLKLVCRNSCGLFFFSKNLQQLLNKDVS